MHFGTMPLKEAHNSYPAVWSNFRPAMQYFLLTSKPFPVRINNSFRRLYGHQVQVFRCANHPSEAELINATLTWHKMF